MPISTISDITPQELLAGRVALLQRQLPFVVLANLFVSSVVVWMMYGRVDPGYLLVWWLAVCGVALTRWAFDSHAWRKGASGRQTWLRALTFAVGSGVSGLLWGGSALFILDLGDPYYTAFVILFLAGMVAGGMPGLSAWAPVYWCYAIPATAPLAAVMWAMSDQTIPGAALFVIFYTLVMMSFSVRLDRAFGDNIRQRYENRMLVKSLQRQKRIAEDANIAKSRFLAAASHDLRQPLYAMELFVDALAETLVDDEQRGYMQRIRQSSAALQDLFNALLDISKLDAGAIEPKPVPVSVDRLVDSIVQEFEPQARAKNLKLQLSYCGAWVRSDRILLGRMLRNLLSNAIRYTREGQVRVECRVEDSQVLITVSDTGVGIADEDQERIFEEFHQLDNPARDRQQGLGLGLAIVRRLSGLLEHPLHLQSAPGRGSSFTLELPRTEAMEEGVAESPRPGVTGWVGEVVVLDDERPIREGLAHMLRAWGMRVHLAGTVQELYEILDVHQPQLLLSDYRLAEGISGLDLVTDLLARPGNELRALLLTGDSAPEELARIHAAGVRVLNKPVASKDLRSAIDAEMAAETVS